MRIDFRKNIDLIPVHQREWVPVTGCDKLSSYQNEVITSTIYVDHHPTTIRNGLKTTLSPRYRLASILPANQDFTFKFDRKIYAEFMDYPVLILQEQWVEDTDDAIELVVKNRYAVPVAVSTRGARNRKKEVALMAGVEMETYETIVKFKNLFTTIRYNKRKHTFIGKTQHRLGQLFTYGTKVLCENFLSADVDLGERFIKMVMSHLVLSFPDRHYDADIFERISNSIIADDREGRYYSYKNIVPIMTWLRRFKKNRHSYGVGLINNLPLKYVGLRLTDISRKFEIPRAYISDLNSHYSALILSALVGKSYNLSLGMFNVAVKDSAENFNQVFTALKRYYNSDDAFRILAMELKESKYDYLKYLLFKDLISGRIAESTSDTQLVFRQGIYEYITDSARMINLLKDMGAENLIEPKNSLIDFHNSLSVTIQKLKTDNQLIPFPEKYLLTGIKARNDIYEIRKPIDTHELIRVGQLMNHCVGSYARSVLNMDVEIVTLYDSENYPLVCMELTKSYSSNRMLIRQAKLSHNRKVVSNPELAEIIINWCDKFEINYKSCADITNNCNLPSVHIPEFDL
jgi:hypothetical protein